MRIKLHTYFTLLLLICFSSTSVFGYIQSNNVLLNGADKIGLNKINIQHPQSEINVAFSTVEDLILENENEDNIEETYSDGDIHNNCEVLLNSILNSIDNTLNCGTKPVSLTILYCVFRI